ncbi:hypothetical protein HYT56_01820 [Candidatus Woesearchaeota archaeon]|nr:hypothetical protein [Candidatus Woesearchaeota archaeon]
MVIISTKIDLEINKETRDIDLEKKIHNLRPLIRIFSKIKFPELEIPEDALIDTGAHISILPLYLWKKLNVEIIAEHKTSGIVPNENIPVSVGYVKANIIDESGDISKDIKFLSYLAFTNKIPLILGMRDLLEKFNLHILFSQNKAYLEEVD